MPSKKKTSVVATLIVGLPYSNMTSAAAKIMKSKKSGLAVSTAEEIDAALKSGENFTVNMALTEQSDRVNTVNLIKNLAEGHGLNVEVNGVFLDTRIWVVSSLMARDGVLPATPKQLMKMNKRLHKTFPPTEADGFANLATIEVSDL